MNYLLWYPPHMLAAYMDFGVGVLIATLLWTYGFKQAPTFGILFAGGALALLPDIDVVWPIIRGHVEGDHHQLLTHFPGFMVPLFTAAVYLAYGSRGAWLACLCLTWHFLHDSPELGGGGIAWAWPFSHTYWSLTGVEVSAYWGDGDTYVRKMWLQPSTLAFRELTAGTAALVAAALVLHKRFYYLMVAIIPVCVWATALFLWYGPLPLGASAIASP